MAVTGFIAFGYVVGHMLGNLQIFISQDQINNYAELLHGSGALLWAVRVFLLAAFIIHIWVSIQLKLENWAARPIGYNGAKTVKATLASRTMIWTGLVILVFVVYHVLHYTVRVTQPEFAGLVDAEGRFDVYSMVIMGFSYPAISIIYIVAVGLLAYHLSHGVASMFQTVGWNNEGWQKRLDAIAWFFTIVLFVGYASVPVAVMTGILKLPAGGM
jgi:succinate dehydrogenase / fumarate reductase cytochrome b subunit